MASGALREYINLHYVCDNCGNCGNFVFDNGKSECHYEIISVVNYDIIDDMWI